MFIRARKLFVSLILLSVFSSALFGGNILKSISVSGNTVTVDFSKSVSSGYINQFILKGKRTKRYVFDFRSCRLASRALSRISKKRYPGFVSVRLSQYRRTTVRLVVETYANDTLTYYRHGNRVSINIHRGSGSGHKDRSGEKSSIRGLFEAIGNIIPVGSVGSEGGSSSEKVYSSQGSVKKQRTRRKEISQKESGEKRRYRVIIDPGHGGHDSGAVGGSSRYIEKKAVLQIAFRVRKYLRSMGFEVYMTRTSDRYVKLRSRTAFANRRHGDIFVSIHANAVSPRSRNRKAYGIETYFLQVTRNERAKRVAAMENSVVLNRKDRISKNVILNSVLTGPKIVLSNKLAIDVQQGMLSNLRKRYRNVKDGGVRPAPFWVLVGAEMPAILVETGYISNRWEKKRLFDPAYQKLLAKGIAEGIARYLANREREFE